jgi:hypothetical protein
MTATVQPAGPRNARVRRDRWVILVVFWVAMALICGAAAIFAAVRAVDTSDVTCPKGRLCASPPVLPASNLSIWTTSLRGVTLQYPTTTFAVDQLDGRTLRLHVRSTHLSGVAATLWVTVQPNGAGAPDEALRHRQSDLSAGILGLATDDDPRTTIPPPRIGLIPGVGGSYRGTVDTPQGPSLPAVVVIAAAGDGRTTAVVSYVVSGTDNPATVRLLRSYLSPILTTFSFRS